MKDIFISATNTDVGKTYTTLQLINILAQKGVRPGVFKPIETGVENNPADATILLESVQKVNRDFQLFDTDDICPIQFTLPAAPFVAAEGQKINLEPIFEKYHQLKKKCDVLLIEGAGGLLVPINKNYFMSDLCRAFQASLLLVTHDKLGCINDTLLNLSYLKNKKIETTWCINLRDPKNFTNVTRPFYKAYFDELFILPSDIEKLAARLIEKLDQ